jgi:hypothetical protein
MSIPEAKASGLQNALQPRLFVSKSSFFLAPILYIDSVYILEILSSPIFAIVATGPRRKPAAKAGNANTVELRIML